MKTVRKIAGLLLLVMMPFVFAACGGDDDDEPAATSTSGNSTVSPIVGTWICTYTSDYATDFYVLVFNNDYTGYLRNDYTRSTSTWQMNFEWSLTTASDGTYLLSVIYKSGDKDMDGPFEGAYDQYSRRVTIAGNTLSIQTSSTTVMLFSRQ